MIEPTNVGGICKWLGRRWETRLLQRVSNIMCEELIAERLGITTVASVPFQRPVWNAGDRAVPQQKLKLVYWSGSRAPGADDGINESLGYCGSQRESSDF